MTPEQMAKDAAAAIQAGTNMTLVLPRPWKNRPPKFPRGELLCENSNGQNVYSYDPIKVLAWLAAMGLVKVETKVVEQPPTT
jgi:hypothetical protein